VVRARALRAKDGQRRGAEARTLTAAHPTLPFGTCLRVTNLENGRTVEVRVNDRGPYAGNRIVDVSESAARALGMHGRGVTRVRLDRCGGSADLDAPAPEPRCQAPSMRVPRLASSRRSAQSSPSQG
jgi:rare lipoprotein A